MNLRESRFLILTLLLHAYPSLHAYDIPEYTPDGVRLLDFRPPPAS
jgi:hypothetical protein